MKVLFMFFVVPSDKQTLHPSLGGSHSLGGGPLHEVGGGRHELPVWFSVAIILQETDEERLVHGLHNSLPNSCKGDSV